MSAFVPPPNQAGNGGNRNRNRNNQQKRVRRSDSGVELDAQGGPGNGGRGGGSGGGNGGSRPVQQQQVNFNVNSLKNMLGVAPVGKPSSGDPEDDDDEDGDAMDVGGLGAVGDPTLMSHMTGAKFGDIVGASVLTKRAIADVMKYTFMTQASYLSQLSQLNIPPIYTLYLLPSLHDSGTKRKHSRDSQRKRRVCQGKNRHGENPGVSHPCHRGADRGEVCLQLHAVDSCDVCEADGAGVVAHERARTTDW